MIIFQNEKDRQAFIEREAKAVASHCDESRRKDARLTAREREWLAGLLVGFAHRVESVTRFDK